MCETAYKTAKKAGSFTHAYNAESQKSYNLDGTS